MRREIARRAGRDSFKLVRFFSELLGSPVPRRRQIDKSVIDSISKQVDAYLVDAWRTFGPEFAKLSPSEQIIRTRSFIGRVFRLTAKIPKDVDPITWYVEVFDLLLGFKAGRIFGSLYLQYLEALNWLVKRLVDRRKVETAQSFLFRWKDSQEAFALAQTYIQGFPRAINYLDRIRKERLERHHLRKLFEYYMIFSGIYESLLQLLIAMVRISNDEPTKYDRLQRTPLAQKMRVLAQVPELRILTAVFETDTRNSIAHQSYRIMYARRRIIFEHNLNLTWNQFRKQLNELSRLVLAISLSPLLYFRDIFAMLDWVLDPSILTKQQA